MKSRCNNPNYRNSHLWRGKGISYPPKWERFTVFLQDMGERPKNTSLDRINGNKGYSKENCRWATKEEQANNVSTNRKITYQGLTLGINQWARKLEIKREVIRGRLELGWSLERIFTEKVVPIQPNIQTIGGVTKSFSEWCRVYGKPSGTVRNRLNRGMGLQEALQAPVGPKTHCKRGHEFTDENTYTYRNMRSCRACKATYMRERNRKLE